MKPAIAAVGLLVGIAATVAVAAPACTLGDCIFSAGFETPTPPAVIGLSYLTGGSIEAYDYGAFGYVPDGQGHLFFVSNVPDNVDGDSDSVLDDPINVACGEVYASLIATDRAGVSYQLSDAPSGMQINSYEELVYQPACGDLGEKDVVLTVMDTQGRSGVMGIVFNNLAPRIVGVDTDQSPLNGIPYGDADADSMIDDVIVQNCGETLSYWIVLNVYGEFQYHLSGDPPPGMTMQTDGGKLTFNDACPGNHDYSVEVNAENGSASAPAEVIRFHVN